MKLQVIILVIALLKFCACALDTLDCNERESSDVLLKLKKKIICDYDNTVAPDTSKNPIGAFFDVELKEFEFEDETQTMTVQLWLILTWSDSRLTWRTEDYDDNEITYVPFDMVWVPDITLFKSDTMEDVNSCTVTDCNIYYNGTVVCPMPCSFSIICPNSDYTNWPFDYVSCVFLYMSKTKSTKKFNFIGQSLTVDTDTAAKNRAWELTSFTSTIMNQTNNLMGFKDEPGTVYSSILMRYTISRHSKELVFQIIIPAALIILMNIFTLVLDADMNERWILYGTYLFSHYVYTEQLGWMLRAKNDSVSNVFSYYSNSHYVTVLLLIESIFMKILIESEEVSQWTSNMIDKSTTSYIGKIILRNEIESAEGINRKKFSCFIDRILIIILIIFYGYTFTTLMPKPSSDSTPYAVIFESY